MVEDSQIKAEVSPFAIREGEIKVFDGKDGYVSMNQIINKINLGHITDIHFQILEIVNEFEFITSRQIYQLLQIKGIEIKSQDKLNKKLEQLIKTKILTRYYFHSDMFRHVLDIRHALQFPRNVSLLLQQSSYPSHTEYFLHSQLHPQQLAYDTVL